MAKKTTQSAKKGKSTADWTQIVTSGFRAMDGFSNIADSICTTIQKSKEADVRIAEIHAGLQQRVEETALETKKIIAENKQAIKKLHMEEERIKNERTANTQSHEERMRDMELKYNIRMRELDFMENILTQMLALYKEYGSMAVVIQNGVTIVNFDVLNQMNTMIGQYQRMIFAEKTDTQNLLSFDDDESDE